MTARDHALDFVIRSVDPRSGIRSGAKRVWNAPRLAPAVCLYGQLTPDEDYRK